MAAITIGTYSFEISDRFAEGYVLNEAEASQMNQVFRENIGNNLRAKIKDGQEIDQDYVTQYAEQYQFGVRVGSSGRTTDPILRMAVELALADIKAKYKEQRKSLPEPKALRVGALKLIGMRPHYRERAQVLIQEARASADVQLDEIESFMDEPVPTQPNGSDEPVAAKPRKGKRALGEESVTA